MRHTPRRPIHKTGAQKLPRKNSGTAFQGGDEKQGRGQLPRDTRPGPVLNRAFVFLSRFARRERRRGKPGGGDNPRIGLDRGCEDPLPDRGLGHRGESAQRLVGRLASPGPAHPMPKHQQRIVEQQGRGATGPRAAQRPNQQVVRGRSDQSPGGTGGWGTASDRCEAKIRGGGVSQKQGPKNTRC